MQKIWGRQSKGNRFERQARIIDSLRPRSADEEELKWQEMSSEQYNNEKKQKYELADPNITEDR
jgi:hypothetical protein